MQLAGICMYTESIPHPEYRTPSLIRYALHTLHVSSLTFGFGCVLTCRRWWHATHTCLNYSVQFMGTSQAFASGYQKYKVPQLCKGCSARHISSANAVAHVLAFPLHAVMMASHIDSNFWAARYYTGLLPWAARYNTWLLIKLTPKGVVFSFLFFSTGLLITLTPKGVVFSFLFY